MAIGGKFDDYIEGISSGKFDTQKVVFWGGYQTDSGVSYNIINPLGIAIAHSGEAITVLISSSSASDSGSGTGARTVYITGLNAAYVEIAEIVTTNGQTAVSTVNSYLRILGIRVLTAGSSNSAAGTVYVGSGAVTVGVPAVVYNYCTSEDNSWNVATYTVPAGYKFFISNVSLINGDWNLGVYFSLNVRTLGSSVWWASGKGQVFGAANIPFTPYFAIDEKSDLSMTSKDGGGTQGVYTLISGYLRAKSLDI